jgi:hypothetical protein
MSRRMASERAFFCVSALLFIGVMDLRVMPLIAAAITVERLAPAGERVARTIGMVAVGAGCFRNLSQSGKPGQLYDPPGPPDTASATTRVDPPHRSNQR